VLANGKSIAAQQVVVAAAAAVAADAASQANAGVAYAT